MVELQTQGSVNSIARRCALACMAHCGALLLLGLVMLRSHEAVAASAPATVVILGVNHSAQLVSEADQPGMLTAFMDEIKPDAVCVERPPELAARGDFYEFTYEVQGIIVPYAAAHPVQLCPIDWMPPVEDEKLAFGIDLDVPPEVRPASDFMAFITFPEAETLAEGLFAADDPHYTAPTVEHFGHESADPAADFPRRLYLYRTFMQAQHIRAAARAHRGGLVLVVVGYDHKPDLEGILGSDSALQLKQPSSFARPSIELAERATSTSQRAAILRFNLLGQQADTGNVNWSWMQRVLLASKHTIADGEWELYHLRLDQLTAALPERSAIERYRALISVLPAELAFTWTGVKDSRRVDSYFDPFGNLSVR